MHKKVWVYILIIVVISSLFPSILIARAEEGKEDLPPSDIPDREYSMQNAPFPGNYGCINENTWQAFINRAEQLEHTRIEKFVSLTVFYEDSTSETIWAEIPIFYSTDGTDIETYLESDILSGGRQKYVFHVRYKENNKINILRPNGLFGENSNQVIGGLSSYRTEGHYVIGGSYESNTWYNAEVINDQYQNKPDQYNIDPTRGWGMYFIKPKFGDWINIPTKTYSHKDTIEIEIQVPHLYESNNWTYEMFKITEGIEKGVIPNFAIRLYSNNVKKIEGSQVVGRDGTWILPYNIKFIEGYMDGTYIHGAKFRATIPMEHAKNANWEAALIVADLFIHEEPFDENYSIIIPDARTWTKYHIFYGIVDSDGDGLDDRTGQPVNEPKPGETIKNDKPNKDDYDDGILGTISYYFDTFIWYIKQPFVFIADLIGSILDWISTTIDGWIDGFTSIFTTLFSFLPAEVILMLALGFATMMIITIIRAIRGS